MGIKQSMGALLIAGVILSACSANHHSIYRQRQLKGTESTVITIDAKQRAIETSFVPYNADGTKDHKAVRRFCSEPSPDVFSVIAQSLSAGGSFGQAADPKSVEVALNLAFSSSEQGSTIPRTQTINMLRELMFRTCERFLSGGYDGKELSIQAIRDQRLMVSILAIEQLTGVVTPKPLTISASGSAGAGLTGEAVVRLDNARKARDDTKKKYDDARAAYAEENKDDACTKAEAVAEAARSTDQKAKVKKCGDLKTAEKDAGTARDTAAEDYAKLSKAVETGGVTVVATTNANAPGGLDSVSPSGISDVSGAVKEIVMRNFSDDSEVMMFCIKLLYEGAPRAIQEADGSNELNKMCVTFLASKAAKQAEENSPGITRAMGLISGRGRTQFERFWTDARAAEFADAKKRDAFIAWLDGELAGLPRRAEQTSCFRRAGGDRVAVEECFISLPPPVQRNAITITYSTGE
jgi:hypothetical protein